MNMGLATDHGGFEMKQQLAKLIAVGHEVVDFGNKAYDANDDYPEFAIPLARAVSRGAVERGVLLCGRVGASVAANPVVGVRAAVCHDDFSARQGVEDDDLNTLCFGGRRLKAWQPKPGRQNQACRTASVLIGTGVIKRNKCLPRQAMWRPMRIGVLAAIIWTASTLNAQTIRAITDAASYSPRVSPGALATIFGTGLANSTAQASSFPLPLSLGGASVSRFNRRK